MTKLLSKDEINALLTDVSSDGVYQNVKDNDKRKIWEYDFKNPNLVHKNQIRLMETLHEKFVKNISVFLSEQLRLTVEMRLVSIDQILYSEFVKSITSPGALYTGKIENPESKFVFDMSPQLAVFMVERLLGGTGSFIDKSRPISVIEKRIMNRFIQKVSTELQLIWQPLKNIS